MQLHFPYEYVPLNPLPKVEAAITPANDINWGEWIHFSEDDDIAPTVPPVPNVALEDAFQCETYSSHMLRLATGTVDTLVVTPRPEEFTPWIPATQSISGIFPWLNPYDDILNWESDRNTDVEKVTVNANLNQEPSSGLEPRLRKRKAPDELEEGSSSASTSKKRKMPAKRGSKRKTRKPRKGETKRIPLESNGRTYVFIFRF